MTFLSRRSLQATWWATVALGLAGACMEGARTQPPPRAGGTLALGAEAKGEQPSGPLKVAFSSPEGPAGVVTEVSVVFDRPVHPVGVVVDAPAPFRVSPEVPGSFRWVGSRAAIFTPERRFPLATAFTVEVAAGLQALDGTRLAEPHRFAFETRRPALVQASPGPEQTGVEPRAELRLELDQVVTPAALSAACQLRIEQNGRSSAAAFDVLPDPQQARVLRARPKRPLPPHSAVSFVIGASLRGVEGPLTSNTSTTVRFFTYDPLAFESVSCARNRDTDPCEAESTVALTFNNGIKLRELATKLHVTPDVGVKLDKGDDGFTTWANLRGAFRAGQSYRVQIDAGLTDSFGQSLQQPASVVFRFADHYPRVDIGAVGRNFFGKSLSVPVASRNVPSFELLTAALTPQDVLSLREAERSGRDGAKDLDWLSHFKGTVRQQVRPGGAKNQIERLDVDALKVLGAGGRGALAIGARYGASSADDRKPAAMKVLSVSDLAITAKLSRFGSLVWVTDRADNAPVAGAQVELHVPGRPSRSYGTDAAGLARIPPEDFAPNLAGESDEARAILVARRGLDSAFAPVSELIEGYRLDVPTDFAGELRPYGVLFTDRGIYRPGDDVWLKGIVRRETPTGNALPGERAVTVTLRSPAGDELSRESVMLTSYGTLSAKLQVPRGARLGTYYATVSGLDHERFLEESLQVNDYRPVELSVTAGAERPAYVQGETAQLEVRASYLFGAAAAGLATSLSVMRLPTWFEVPGADDFRTDSHAYYDDLPEVSPPRLLRNETRLLDEQGRLSWSEKLDERAQHGPEVLRIDAETTDVSRQGVASSGSALVHPAALYVGLRSSGSSFVEAPGAATPQVLVFDVAGKRQIGRRVALELYERRYTYAREGSGDDYRSVGKLVDRQVARCELTSAAEPTSCSLAVPAAGYYVVLARAKDDKNRSAEAALPLYAAGSGEPTWQDNDRRSLTLVLDKKSYAVGQRARVLVKSPYKDAEALITVERSGVYQSFHRVLHGTAPSFEIPVGADLLPNAFVGVHLLPKRSGKGEPLEPGSYRVGYANLLVDAEGRRLAVQLATNKPDYRPGENVDVRLAVKDALGVVQPNTELTLYAADEGVLSLINYRTPDPLQTFSAPRALQVATLESRDAEGRISLEGLGGGDKGRDGGGGDNDVGGARRDFRQTAYFNPRIITDARGEAKVSFKLPESLTTYRLMAVAVSRGDRFGFTQARVTTSKRLMARPALPRFVRAGDSFEAGVVVSKKAMGAGKVRVTAAFTGLTASVPLSRELEVPQDGSREVRFAVQAPHPGSATLRFDVEGGEERDSVLRSLTVALPMAPEATAIYGQTGGAQREMLGNLSAARADAGSLSVSLSSTALVGVDQTALDLIDYPYSCTEQLSSKILPLVGLGELGTALGFALPADARQRATAAVNEVLARQGGDGGFGMWPESSRSEEWVSAYATLALWRAARAGIVVPKHALDGARDYLRAVVQRMERDRPELLPAAALSLDVLGELGAPDPGSINRLYERRAELPSFGKALLLHAALSAKLASDVPKELRRDLEAKLHVDGARAVSEDDTAGKYAAIFASPARSQALVLRALAAGGKHPLLGGLVRGLLDARRQGKFRTTQESAWALLALDDYRRVAESEPAHFDASFSLGSAELGQASFAAASPLSRRFELPLGKLLERGGEPLRFEKQGSGTLFYEARLRYVRRELPRAPLDAGFFIEKSLHRVSAENLSKRAPAGAPPGVASQIAAGDLVMVELTVVTPAARQFVVVDDALPAGLEAIDPKLSITAEWLKNTDLSDDASTNGEAGARSEVRDDRVLFFVDELPAGLSRYRYLARATSLGRFLVPPTRIEEMYQPEVFGRTGATELTVK